MANDVSNRLVVTGDADEVAAFHDLATEQDKPLPATDNEQAYPLFRRLRAAVKASAAISAKANVHNPHYEAPNGARLLGGDISDGRVEYKFASRDEWPAYELVRAVERWSGLTFTLRSAKPKLRVGRSVDLRRR